MLYVPFLVMSFLCLLFQDYFYQWNIISRTYEGTSLIEALLRILFFIDIETPLHGLLWFIRCLFFSIILFWLIINLVKSKKSQIIIITLGAILGWSLLACGSRLPLAPERIPIVCSVIFIGHLVRNSLNDSIINRVGHCYHY